MRLKRVRLFGFKTFADRTELSLDGGIIAVVGPNGCGKSNLVDAILWGLGEGNARNLRAQSSQDVIFSGSSRRKPIGFAEVSLLFDNEDGALPIDTPEVSITRKLTRSGDSDYAINRQNCRLRDIYDLLADSGLGRAGYSIVGQKEIDSALSASAEDRRGWIDEAAGVQRYRTRKVESLKRLAQAQEHLSRVADILRELELQREPLQEEAEVALRYKNVLESLREVEIGLLVTEVAKAVRELSDVEKRIEETVRLSREENLRAEKLDAEVQETGRRVSDLESEMDRIRSSHQEALTALERADANLRVLQERLQSLDDQEKHLAEDAMTAEERITEAEREYAEASHEAEREDTAFAALRTELSGASAETKKLSAELQSIERELAAARDQHVRYLKSQAERAHRAEIQSLATRELKGIESALPELEAAIAEAQQSYDTLQAAASQIQSEVKLREDALTALRRDEEQDAQATRKALAERAALEGRIRGIEATIDAHEGLNQGARAVMEAAERGILKSEFTPVAEAIEVDKDLALAIETALGNSANDLIVDDQRDAKEAIEWLKANRAGRATFQPIPLMRPSEVSPEMRRLMHETGVVGRASELVSCANRHRPVIDSLLGRILVLETLDDALRLARTGGWSRMVTLDGEVLHSSGAVTGGHQARQGYGIVQRKADLAELSDELDKLNKIVSGHEKRSQKRQAERQKALDELDGLKHKLGDGHTEREEARQFLQSLTDEMRTAQKERERLLRDLGAGGAESIEDADVLAVEARRDQVLKALAAKSADEEQAEARLREAEARTTQAHARASAAERRLLHAKEHDQARQKRLGGLEPERERIRREIEVAGKARDHAFETRTKAEAALAARQAAKRELLEASMRLVEEAKAARANASAVGDAAHQAELTRARAESRKAAALERLYQEYSLLEEDALAQEGMHEVPPDAGSVVSRLRRELKSMGDVNLGAIEAYDRLTVRFEELNAQQADILEGIEQVEASVKELDKLTRDRFLNTFLAVQEGFSEMFLRLFGGGEGKMSLSDPNNVLESGIDLEITLPGKKRQPLALLSGGERSLCASAFLFALLKVKPSPLVVLDEVDAPLDGANVERFAATIRQFTDKTQFLVITHNPATIAAADVWAGISMQEPGVSMLIPYTPSKPVEMAPELPFEKASI